MVKLIVGCVIDSEWQAINIVQRLKSEDFASSEISLLFPERSATEPEDSVSPLRTERGGWSVAPNVLVGALGWVSGFGASSHPRLGSFLRAGPIKDALTAWDGQTEEQLETLLQLLGLSEECASRFAERITDGEILLVIHTEQRARATGAERIFAHFGARDICNCDRQLAVAPSSPFTSSDLTFDSETDFRPTQV